VKNSHNVFLCCYSTYSKTEDSGHIGVCHGQQYVRKPSIAQSYNDFMGGLNTYDAMLYLYLDKRRMGKYWKEVCFNIFSRIVLNSWIIVEEIMPAGSKPIFRLDCTIKIVER
jgi:hypothetical protein